MGRAPTTDELAKMSEAEQMLKGNWAKPGGDRLPQPVRDRVRELTADLGGGTLGMKSHVWLAAIQLLLALDREAIYERVTTIRQLAETGKLTMAHFSRKAVGRRQPEQTAGEAVRRRLRKGRPRKPPT